MEACMHLNPHCTSPLPRAMRQVCRCQLLEAGATIWDESEEKLPGGLSRATVVEMKRIIVAS